MSSALIFGVRSWQNQFAHALGKLGPMPHTLLFVCSLLFAALAAAPVSAASETEETAAKKKWLIVFFM